MTTAGEFCNRWVVFATGDEPLIAALRRMREHHVGALVIVEERGGERFPVGMITDRDIAMHALDDGAKDLETTPVRDLVARDLVSASEREALVDVVKRMRAFGVRRIPVVDSGGALQGLIAFDDVIRFVAEELGDLAALLSQEQEREWAEDRGLVPPTQSAAG